MIFNLYSTVCLFNFNCKYSDCVGWLTHTLLTVSAKWMFRMQITHVEVEVHELRYLINHVSAEACQEIDGVSGKNKLAIVLIASKNR